MGGSWELGGRGGTPKGNLTPFTLSRSGSWKVTRGSRTWLSLLERKGRPGLLGCRRKLALHWGYVWDQALGHIRF